MSAEGEGGHKKPHAVQTEAALLCRSCLVPQKHINNCRGKEALGCSPSSGRPASFTSSWLKTGTSQTHAPAPSSAPGIQGKPLVLLCTAGFSLTPSQSKTRFRNTGSVLHLPAVLYKVTTPLALAVPHTACFPPTVLIWTQLRDLNKRTDTQQAHTAH